MPRSGLLWYDPEPERSLLEKVDDAASRYYAKFGVPANVAYVNPSAFGTQVPQPFETGTTCGRVIVAPKATILRGHIWIGVQEEPTPQQP